jgi:hypothetical protein
MTGKKTFIQETCEVLLEIERQTVEHFGEERAHRLLLIADDGLTITAEVMKCYSQQEQLNLVYHHAWGAFKELRWLQLFFLAGQYPLLKSRLRYIWEGMYRAYVVEAHSDPTVRSLSPDEKLRWLEEQPTRPNWSNCVEMVLHDIFPLAAREEEVRGIITTSGRT